jgi:hypothetical protein
MKDEKWYKKRHIISFFTRIDTTVKEMIGSLEMAMKGEQPGLY